MSSNMEKMSPKPIDEKSWMPARAGLHDHNVVAGTLLRVGKDFIGLGTP
jgi:hypothetical protein